LAGVRRTLLLLALALALGGCGTAGTSGEPPLPPRAAEPQRAVLGWREFHPARVGERLVFEVATLAVTKQGWSAAVAVVNRTELRFEVETGPGDYSFGLMLFPTGDLKVVEESNRQGVLPPVRPGDDDRAAAAAVPAAGRDLAGDAERPRCARRRELGACRLRHVRGRGRCAGRVQSGSSGSPITHTGCSNVRPSEVQPSKEEQWTRARH
jgi:hypothetical protein